MDNNKTVPNNIEAEEAFLGSLLIDPTAMSRVTLQGGDLYLQKHRWIYETMQRIHARRDPLDFLTVTTDLEQRGHLEAVGGAVYISKLINAVPSAISIESYAALVEEAAVRRRLLDAASAIARLAYDEGKALSDVLDGAETTVFRARGQRQTTGNRKIEAVSQTVLDDLTGAQTSGTPLVFSTGYTDLDHKLKLRRGELTLVAARTSIGKTALLLNIAQRAAIAGLRVLFFSLEMTAETLVHRMIVSEGRVTLDELSSGVIRDEKWAYVVDDLAKFSTLPLWIDDTPSNSMPAIRAQALRLASTEGIDLVCVDYVQLVRGGEKVERRDLEIGLVTRGLKALSKELHCPVLAAAQLGRDAENSRPTLAHLRESGSQEQDADNVLFIHRPREITGNTAVEIIIAKQRQGPTGVVSMVWIPSRIAFVPKAYDNGGGRYA